MNGHFGQLDQAFKALWINNRGAVSRNQRISQLAPEQIGVFAADVVNGKDEPVSLSKPNFKKHQRLVLKQGLHKTLGNRNPIITRTDRKHRSTVEFTREDIVEWRGKKGVKGSVGEIIAIGYDGLDASKDIAKGVKLDAKPLHFNFRFSGEPIRRFFGKTFLDHKIVIDKGLCLGDCECYDACGQVDGNLIADKLIAELEKGFLASTHTKEAFAKVNFKDLIKVSKIRKCATGTTIPAIATTEYKKWQITIPSGIPGVFGKLSEAFPALQIDLESYTTEGAVYTAWTPASVTTLADFEITDYVLPVCDTCPDCPVEAERVEGVKNVQVRVACGATAPTLTGQISSLLVSSDLIGGDVYLIKVPKTQTDAAIEAQADALDCSIVSIIGDEATYCIGQTMEFEWASCESAFTTKKIYQLVLPNHHCDKTADRLEELQAAYPELSISIRQTGTCITSYQAEVESDRLPEEDCDREFGIFTFVKPANYAGFSWTEEKPVVAVPVCEPVEEAEKPCCVTGLIIETARWNEDLSECDFGYTSWSPTLTKPIKLQVNVHSLDYSNNPCDETQIYSTVLQKATFEKGTDGRLVQEWEKIQLSYESNNGWTQNPIVNNALGFKSVADPTAIYDVYYLTLKRKQYGTSHAWQFQERTTYAFPVISGQGKDFEAFMNELVLSAGDPKLTAVIL